MQDWMRQGDPVDVNEALQTTLANLSAAVEECGASVMWDPLPSVRIHGTLFRQVFRNLIANAIKYRNPDLAPKVHVGGKRHDRDCVFSVRDKGIGVEPDYKEYIFGLFKRLHTEGEYSGTGIGLAICQRVVERYNGRIRVESEPGQRSTFTFTIPFDAPADR
jgi:light-regulated signal transduction histidine kinase (bacteriophytochrome)